MSAKPRACSYCQEEVQGLRVRCTVCPDFKLCLQCFSAGAEIGQHKNDEPYQFVDAGMPCLFGRNKWTPQEEIHLLDATEYYGFGNWEDIANHIETRTPEEAKEEYVHRYLDATLGKMCWAPALRRRPRYRDPIKEEKGALSHASISKMPLLDVSSQEAAQLGYMVLRDDFEKEFDNEAEYLISNLSINHDKDDCLDIALKLTQVDMYTQRLRERARRKRIAKDYMLVSQFFSLMKDRPNVKKKPRETRVLEERTKVLCQFQTAEEHDQLLVNLQREKNLRRRLAELLICRRNGITKFEDCESFYNYRQQHIGSTSPQLISTSSLSFISKKKRKKRKLLFNKQKLHAPHRQPHLLALARRRLKSLCPA